MIFQAQTDIAAPPDHVFASVSDMDRIAALVERVGGQLTGKDPAAGEWHMTGAFFGISVDAPITIARQPEVNRMNLRLQQSGLVARSDSLVTGAGRASVLAVSVTLEPAGMRGRMLMGALKMAEARIAEQFQSGLHRLGNRIARDYAPD